MKTYNKPAPSKILAKFDNELNNLLANDLREYINSNTFLMRKKQAVIQNTLIVS